MVFLARDFVLKTIGDEREVGVARFLVPDRWDVLLSPLRPSMFSEPLDLLVRTAPPPLLLADLDAEGLPRRTSAGAAPDLGRPDPSLLSRARRRGRASARIDYGEREARLVLAPAGDGFAALVFGENDLEQGGFAFAKVLLTYSGVCLLYALALLVRRGTRRTPLLFRHRVSLFLVVLSVPPVPLLAAYNTRVSNQRYEREIRERLVRRLDTAETLLGQAAGPVDNDWCTRFAANHRMDVNVYRGQELVATSRPGVWDTGLLARRLAAPPYVELELEKRREHVGREDFAHVADLRAAYRRIERGGDALILAAPALDDRRALERLAAEGNSLLLAIFLLAATVTVFGGLFLSRSLTRPLHELRQATRKVALGEFEVSLREGRTDEFGDLVRAFNQMTIELRGAQDLRVRAEKAAAWREMARQIAHDIRNPLTPIKLTIQNLIAVHRADPAAFEQEFEQGARLILEQIEALHRIAGDFSAYARLPARRLEPVPLGELMAEIAALYAASGGAAVRVDAPPEPLPVQGDRDELRRALINLVANGRQAASKSVLLRARAEDGFVRLDVVDDGIGIAPEALARIFEPSFTTKTSGTGLGLPIVKRIVDDHGGTIAIATEPGRGTTVTVRFPRA
jgi:signal transduction histidine kinase